jgi:hypothetical protein
VYVRRRDDDAAVARRMRKDLREAQEALLDEMVALERAHRSGEVGPKTHARVRVSLLDALARIRLMLDAKPAAAPSAKPPPKTESSA